MIKNCFTSYFSISQREKKDAKTDIQMLSQK